MTLLGCIVRRAFERVGLVHAVALLRCFQIVGHDDGTVVDVDEVMGVTHEGRERAPACLCLPPTLRETAGNVWGRGHAKRATSDFIHSRALVVAWLWSGILVGKRDAGETPRPTPRSCLPMVEKLLFTEAAL